MRRNKQNILFILRVPPPYGGGEIVSEILEKNLRDEFQFHLIKQKNHNKKNRPILGLLKYFMD